jgi:hypothetical protein
VEVNTHREDYRKDKADKSDRQKEKTSLVQKKKPPQQREKGVTRLGVQVDQQGHNNKNNSNNKSQQ